MSEKEESLKLANLILDRPWADPDDDLAVLARNLLRTHEINQALQSEIRLLRGQLESATRKDKP